MANPGAILCCSSVVPIDDTNRQDEEVDHMAFIDFASLSGTTQTSATTPRENNQLLSIPKDEDLDHFFICRHLVQREPNDVTGLEENWHGTTRYWLAYTRLSSNSTPAYRYVEAEFGDREKLGENDYLAESKLGGDALVGTGCGRWAALGEEEALELSSARTTLAVLSLHLKRGPDDREAEQVFVI
ncbi:hypothetical protein LTR10_011017 [Elasticomyces elasticus]|nr:hypothetical protein LTR10_011017 [Elasticomyces elasticus]KAK4968621.1 hypothetical protein LTR42_009904 [Elasticomyces elasticus]